MKKIPIVIALLQLVFYTMAAQDSAEKTMNSKSPVLISQDSLVRIALEHSKSLKAAQSQEESSRLEASTGNTPPDPEVEFGYLSGFPASVGDRIDFRVTQEFEFPTAYIHMSKAKDLKIEAAGLRYAITRQEISVQARQYWIERVYLNKLEQILSERLGKAEKLHSHYIKMTESGETGLLSLSQSNLQTVALRGQLEQVKGDIKLNSQAILELTGGEISQISDTLFPASGLLDINALNEAYQKSPSMEYYSGELSLKGVQKQLAVSKALPKFNAGYYSETVIDQRFRGVSLGLTIPLWENSNKLKYAKAEIVNAAAREESFRSKQQMKLEQDISRWKTLGKQVKDLNEALALVNDEALLFKALEVGEISLSEYIFSSEYYFQNVRKLLEYERDLLFVEAELMRVYY